MKLIMKRMTAMVLAIAMCMSLLCSGAWAADITETDPAEASVVEMTETTPEEIEDVLPEEEPADPAPELPEESTETPVEIPEEAEAPAEPEAEPATVTETTTEEEAAPEEEIGASEGEETQLIPIAKVNPIYDDILTVDDLPKPDPIRLLQGTSSTVYTSVSAAASFLRSQMVAREGYISFTIKTGSSDYNDLLGQVVDAAFKHTGKGNEGDYLMLHWGGYSGEYSSANGGFTYYLYFDYYSDAAQEKQVTARVNEIVSSLGLKDKTPYNRVKAIYDFICTSIVYDYDYDYKQYIGDMTPWTAYGGLIDHTCVCQGYSEIFYRLALTSGLDSRCITSEEICHAWNIVKVDTKYYFNVDATWDSNIYEAYGRMYYDYFLLSNAHFTDHPRDPEYTTSSFNSSYPMSSVDYFSSTLLPPTVSNTTAGVKIEWNAVSGAAKYRVYRKVYGGSYAKLADVTSLSYVDKTAKSGTKYVYTVRTINSSGALFGTTPSGKSLIRLSNATISSLANASSGMVVKWTKTPGATGYYIYRKTSSSGYTKIKTITSGSTVSYTDTTAANGTAYTYTVRAYSGSTMSAYTGTSTVRMSSSSITGLSNVSGKKMKVTWGKNAKATGYLIQYSTKSDFSSGNKSVTITGASTVSKTISSLTKGKTYYVRVRSYKTVSGTKYYSGWSGKKSVKISK